MSPRSSSSGRQAFIGSYFPVTTHSPWSLSTVALFLGLGLALSIVPCVVLISPLLGAEFMASVMLLSKKSLPTLQGLGGGGGPGLALGVS